MIIIWRKNEVAYEVIIFWVCKNVCVYIYIYIYIIVYNFSCNYDYYDVIANTVVIIVNSY